MAHKRGVHDTLDGLSWYFRGDSKRLHSSPGRRNFLFWGELCHTRFLMSHINMLSTSPDMTTTPSDLSNTPRDMHKHFLIFMSLLKVPYLYLRYITVYNEPISALQKYFTLSEVSFTLLWRAINPSCIQHTPPWRVTNLSLLPKNTVVQEVQNIDDVHDFSPFSGYSMPPEIWKSLITPLFLY